MPSAQLHLFYFLAAVAVGAFAGGPLGDRFGRKYVIWFSILGPLPFTLMLPYANLFWTGILSVVIGAILASAFPAIVVYAQELLPGKLGMISGVFYGFSFGMGAIGAALLGVLADATSITFVYKVCAFLPLMGLLTVFLPESEKARMSSRPGREEICRCGFAHAPGADRSGRSLRSHRAPVPARHRRIDRNRQPNAPIPSAMRRMKQCRALSIAIPAGCCSRRCRAARSIAASVSAANRSGREKPRP